MPTVKTAPSSNTNGELNEKLGELRSLLGQIAKTAPDAALAKLEDLKSCAAELGDTCEEKAGDATKAVVRGIRRHPIPVVFAAVGTGLLAWWLLSRNERTA